MNKLKTNSQSYLGPFITMVILMSLVGLITSINQQFQAPMQAAYLRQAGDLENTLATLINFSFFLAYLVMGNTAAKAIDKVGYRGALIRGLIILLAGFSLFELSALQFTMFQNTVTIAGATIPYAYFIFLLGSFVAGTSLTFLQAAINPYLVASKVPGTSDIQRQSIGGAGNSSMTTIGPLIVAFLIFGGKEADEIKVDSLFIPLAVLIGIVAILAIVLKNLNLPDIEGSTADKDEKLTKSVWSFSHLALGVAAIFFYVGVEVAVGANINLYAISLTDADGNSLYTIGKAAQMASFYWGGMLVGRLMGSFVSSIAARTQLLVTSIGATILVVLSMVTGNPWFLVGVGLFHSIMWPAIFSLAIKDLGKYTSKGSGALMMGVVGGAILPFIQGVSADVLGDWSWTWIIVIVGEAFLLYYAISGHKVKQRGDDVEA